VVRDDKVQPIEGNVMGAWRAAGSPRPLKGLRLLAPCEPSKVVALGLNYKSHAQEIGVPLPKDPVVFFKPPTSLIGPEQPIVHPKRSSRVDYEAELACVIKKTARRVPAKDALKHVWGYTCLNDVTARDIQAWGGNYMYLCWSKGYDTFCPVGPWIETGIDPDNVQVECYLNGERKQSASTSDFIFSMAEQVSIASHVMTLLPGDLIATGTPSGIGPMQVGDVVEIRISGIGSLKNPIVAEE
jgi:2-keto-4-pentenoate hydratase/2-oxohepta-3-ene-1,7-dioic acid hydratase in catechol pathway